ncbi:MAG: Cysteine/O-acetylserine efflux protein [Alphaproteobacteria bacterium MarineAlpha2_Bin1]|nr:MAG: Cysteine/O-acetylserine efflux protein [Alphaproteobacteria bacterium MarineAlpha2_Bin1]
MFELYLALVLFAFVSSVTPGPNNVMLLASGANFGFIKSIPHMLGISIGHVFMTILIGTMIMEIFKLYPVTFMILKIFCCVYLIYFAWKIANISIEKSDKTRSRPFSFYQAAIFQWVNPKAWAMSLTAITIYAPEKNFFSVCIVAIIFGFVNLPCVSIWTIFGQNLRIFLNTNKRLKFFNFTMAFLLIMTLYPILDLGP